MMKILLPVPDLFILFLAVQGLILSGILLYSSKKIRSNRWIAAMLFLISETTLYAELKANGLFDKYPVIIPYLLVLRLAIGPVIYFYTRGLVYGDKKMRGKDYLHFLPVLYDLKIQFIYLAFVAGLLSVPGVTDFYFSAGTQYFLFWQPWIYDNIPTLISLITYSAVSYRITGNAIKNTELTAYKLADLKWLRMLIYFIFALTAVFFINIIWRWSNYFLFIPAIGFAYWLGMATIMRQSKMSTGDVQEYNKPPARIHFTAAEAAKYQQQLIVLMEQERIYLDPGLKLDVLADKLSLPEKLASSLLNQHIGKNFNDFVNEYRVQEAQKRLADPGQSQFTIAAIAADCGFNSLATFQRCFKQIAGITPSQYQNGLKAGKPSPNVIVNTNIN
ncbi:MAG: Helix-turn-helix protein [Mucilaginibacter sp.]|nr:Helix-turn-helix protein [Mucilaginibacter sp.]